MLPQHTCVPTMWVKLHTKLAGSAMDNVPLPRSSGVPWTKFYMGSH